ncbi:MAG: hypothetical protein ACI85F_002539 [Bacteroidia bacterium]|jgi:hypothetical protein
MKYRIAWVAVLLPLLVVTAAAQVVSDSLQQVKPNFWAFESLSIPQVGQAKGQRPVLVAVVDDGFNLNHKCIKDHIYRNPNESVTGKDDDDNSFRDDIVGWDIADSDNDVSIPKGREQFFYHGTMVAGVIAQVAQRAYGDRASELVKILPVKASKNDGQKHDYTLGYEGIEYAVRMGADIVVCAWGGGKYDSEKHNQIFKEAEEKGVLIIAAAGNFYSERSDPPASISSVYSIAAVDSELRKTKASNYGSQIDISAAGEFVYAPHPAGNATYGYLDGTSSASALVGGCAAVLMASSPNAEASEVMLALKNTAKPIDAFNLQKTGRMGAGIPDIGQALDFLSNKKTRASYFDSARPEGSIVINKYSDKTEWRIEPRGGFEEFEFSLFGKGWGDDEPIEFYSKDSLIGSHRPNAFPPKLYVESEAVTIKYAGKRGKDQREILYSSVPTDSTKLYCNEATQLGGSKGSFGDGSEDEQYANRTSCKWHISVEEGKNVRLDFDQFDTEAKTDIVYIFRGRGTQQENLIAKFTGSDLPPNIVSSSNEVLVWFVTNPSKTGKGWHLNYWSTDESPGIKGVRNH